MPDPIILGYGAVSAHYNTILPYSYDTWRQSSLITSTSTPRPRPQASGSQRGQIDWLATFGGN